jgi:TAG lipase/steryl ester hydrolase/phospholipase A2/LPA acyltransferase
MVLGSNPSNFFLAPLWITVCLVLFLFQAFFVLLNLWLLSIELLLLLALSLTRQRIRKQEKSSRLLESRLNQVVTANEFQNIADQLDAIEGGCEWRKDPFSDECDWKLIEATVKELRAARMLSQPDLQTILFVLAPVLTRGFAGADKACMFNVARGGTKESIDELTDETIKALDILCDSSHIPHSDKLAILDHARLRYGRTALVLSGGGTLALSSLGVIRALLESGVGLPRVIAGTSGGAIVAGLVACKTDDELLKDVTDSRLATRDGTFFDPLPTQITQFFTSWLRGSARLMDADHLASKLKAYYGLDTTFLSAWQVTGRIVNITVSFTGNSGKSTVLNYLSSPTVYLWSAVTASCALPGVMKPVTLFSRGFDGKPCRFEHVHYIDGTLKADVPFKDLAVLFHVQRVIVSQTNPHLNLWLRQRHYMEITARLSTKPWPSTMNVLDYLCFLISSDISTRLSVLSKLNFLPKFFGEDFSELLSQEFAGDCTIVPHQVLLSQFRALSHPSEGEVANLINAGLRATLPKLSHINHLLRVERKLSECVSRLRRPDQPLPHLDGPSVLSARASPEDLTGMPGIASYAVGLSGLDEDERAHLGTSNLRLNIRGTPNTFPFIGSPLPEPSIQFTNERTPTRNHTRNESVFRIGSTSPPVGVNRGDN